MKFLARWGNACGTPFKKTEFCDKHIQWEYQRLFLEDRDRQPWVFCSSVNMKESVEKIEKAIEADTDKTGDGVSSSSSSSSDSVARNSSPPPSRSKPSQPLPPSPSILPEPAASTKSKPNTHIPSHAPIAKPTKDPKQHPPSNVYNSSVQNIIDHHPHNLLTSMNSGGSIIADNNKEMKEFMKMLKNKSGNKSKAKNTRRNKHNKSK
jgi:hypothetical protein